MIFFDLYNITESPKEVSKMPLYRSSKFYLSLHGVTPLDHSSRGVIHCTFTAAPLPAHFFKKEPSSILFHFARRTRYLSHFSLTAILKTSHFFFRWKYIEVLRKSPGIDSCNQLTLGTSQKFIEALRYVWYFC
jgi:hypothetical protein